MPEDSEKPASENGKEAEDATPQRTPHDRRIFGHLRNIRSSCQYLEGRIVVVLQQSVALSAAPRKDYIEKALNRTLLGRVEKKIEAQFAAIEKVFSIDAAELEWGADEVTLISFTWAQVKDSLAAAIGAYEGAELLFKSVLEDLDRIVYHCESLTLSPRINDILANLRIGQPLDMDFALNDELPQDPRLRSRLIQDLAQQSVVLTGGVVDADQAIVFRTALTRTGQLMSSWRLMAAILLGLLLPVGLAFFGRSLPGWPFAPKDLAMLLANYALIFLGSGAHFAVEALKAAKKQTRPSFQALNDWVLWVHVREAQVFKGIAYIWTGYLLLSFGIHTLSWPAAFFAGYSIDSITELFLGRFESAVAVNTKLLTKTEN